MISTNLTTVEITADSNNNPVAVLASTPSITTVNVGEDGVVSLNTIQSPSVEVIAGSPENVNISVIQESAVVITTDPTSDTTVIVDENGVVTINTIEDLPVQITITPQEVVQITPLEEVAVVLITPASQGPAGPVGPIGPPGGTYIFTTDVPLSGHIAVYVKEDGTLDYADSTSIDSLGTVVGLTTQAYVSGDDVNVADKGLLSHSGWTFTPGLKVFVGTNGALVQSLPLGAIFAQPVGIMLSSTLMCINIEAPIVVA